MNGLKTETATKRLGKLLRAKRKALGLNQEELAARVLGDSSKRARISEYERGVHEPRDYLDKLVDVLKISDEELDAALLGPTPDTDKWHSVEGGFLPAAPENLIGQKDVCQRITEHLRSQKGRGFLLHGMGGVGKTAIIAHVIQNLPRRFQRPYFFLNVRGFDSANNSADLDQLTPPLTRLIRRYSDFKGQLPENRTDLIALWKQTSHAVEDIIILDNVADQKQLEALFPLGDTPWLATSRLRLNIKGDAIQIDPLAVEFGAALATDICADDGYDLAEGLAIRLSEACEHLPLAIEVAASTIAITPSLDIEDFLTRLETERKRLDLSENWEEAVMSRLKVSIDHLPIDHQKIWCLFGLFKDGFFADAAKALSPQTDMPVILASCDRRHLISSTPVGADNTTRYYLHDLLRALALRMFDELKSPAQIQTKRAFAKHFASFVDHISKLAPNAFDNFAIKARLELEIDNIASALEFSLEDEEDIEAVERVLTLVTNPELRQRYPVQDRLAWLEKTSASLASN